MDAFLNRLGKAILIRTTMYVLVQTDPRSSPQLSSCLAFRSKAYMYSIYSDQPVSTSSLIRDFVLCWYYSLHSAFEKRQRWSTLSLVEKQAVRLCPKDTFSWHNIFWIVLLTFIIIWVDRYYKTTSFLVKCHIKDEIPHGFIEYYFLVYC